MTQKHTREVFTLVLDSDEAYFDQYSGARYEVNFDALFQGREKFYKRCAVRGNWITDRILETQLGNVVGFLEISGLLSGHLHGDSAYPLLILYPSPSMNFTGNPTQNIYETGTGELNSLENEHGIQTMSVPSGVRRFFVQETSVANNSISEYMAGYKLVLQFELYN